MAYQLEARDSKWLFKQKDNKNVGPGIYHQTETQWNMKTETIPEVDDVSDNRRSSVEDRKRSIAFNSNISRDKLNTQYNPGPGQYDTKSGGAFKIDYMNDQSRRIVSQEGGPRSAAFTAGTSNRLSNQFSHNPAAKSRDGLAPNLTATNFMSLDSHGNPSYIIKDGGTLKKKLQPMAADKVPKAPSFIEKHMIDQVTAPGMYEAAEGIGGKQTKKHINQFATAERLI